MRTRGHRSEALRIAIRSKRGRERTGAVDALLGIDLGTTGCKAAVCSVKGEVLGTGYIEYPLISPRPEIVEQDANLWWSLTRQVVKQAIADSWPRSIDDRAARKEWGWQPGYDLDRMTADMLEKLGQRYAEGKL